MTFGSESPRLPDRPGHDEPVPFLAPRDMFSGLASNRTAVPKRVPVMSSVLARGVDGPAVDVEGRSSDVEERHLRQL